jgi:hypothetical protein
MFGKQYSFPIYFLLQHLQKLIAICMLDYTPLEEYKQIYIYNMYSKLANLCCNLHCVES